MKAKVFDKQFDEGTDITPALDNAEGVSNIFEHICNDMLRRACVYLPQSIR